MFPQPYGQKAEPGRSGNERVVSMRAESTLIKPTLEGGGARNVSFRSKKEGKTSIKLHNTQKGYVSQAIYGPIRP